MTPCRTAAAVAVALGLVAVPATANAGGGHDDAVTTAVTTGLDGPRQLSQYRGNRVVVA